MVIYGLTVLVYSLTSSSSAVSVLFLTFLVPGVLFSALAGVYVDRLDRRLILVATNLLRAAMFGLMLLARDQLAAIYLLNVAVSVVTTFFAPAAMCAEAFSLLVKNPVHSSTTSTPSSFQGNSAGLRLAQTRMRSPLITR